jgi:phosphatidylglycerophosphatase C
MNNQNLKISIFDLDGTLTKKDTYLPYLVGFLIRNPKYWLRSIVLPVAVIMFFFKMRNNQWLKETFLKAIFKGEHLENIQNWNNEYLSKLYRDEMNKDIVSILKNKQAASETVILATASLDIYIYDIAKELNISHVICTRTQKNDGVIVGKLDGDNCYGPEKLNRIEKYLKENDLKGEIHFYSDHASDYSVMEYADFPYAVYPTKKMREIALKENIPIIEN